LNYARSTCLNDNPLRFASPCRRCPLPAFHSTTPTKIAAI